MKAKALTIAGLCALAVALAVPAGVVAATPTVTQVKGSDSGTFSICGLDLNYDFSASGVAIVKSSGVAPSPRRNAGGSGRFASSACTSDAARSTAQNQRIRMGAQGY